MDTRANRQQYWSEHVSAYKQSGLSQKEYCRLADIGYWSFNQWKRRIENQQRIQPITEVKSKPALQTSKPDSTIVISLNHSLKISIPLSASPEMIGQIIKSLEGYSCR